MSDRKISLALALSLLLAPAAFAQDADSAPDADAPPVGGLSMGEPLTDEDRDPEVGENYVAAEFGDWLMTCVHTELEADPCQLYQLMQDDEGNSVAEINLFGLPEGAGGEAVAGANIVTPLGTQLTAQLTMRIDSGQAKRYPFSVCWAMGCVAQVGFTADELTTLQRGNQATLIIVPAMVPDEQVPITMSLMGFTAGYNAVNEANAANQAAIEAAIAAQEAEGEDGEETGED